LAASKARVTVRVMNRSHTLVALVSLLLVTACLKSGGNTANRADDPKGAAEDASQSKRDAGAAVLGRESTDEAADSAASPNTADPAASPEAAADDESSGDAPHSNSELANTDAGSPTGVVGSGGSGGSGGIASGAGGGLQSGEGEGGAAGMTPIGTPSVGSGGASGGAPNQPSGSGGATGTPSGAGCEPNSLRCDADAPQVCDADRIWRPLLACEAELRCIAGECKEPLTHACPLIPTLPQFSSGSHVVDGDGSEFADIAPVTFTLSNAPIVSATYSAALPTTVSLRMAWSDQAFVAHVHVEDPAIYTYEGSTLEYFWQGDNVQFFIAPTDALSGTYSGTEDGGATHLVIVPPSDTRTAQAIEVYEPCYACVDASFSAANYAARAVTGGYEVELSWPWSAPDGSFSPGDRVALNLIVGARDDADAGLQLEGLLANNPVGADTPCGGATHPGCDDRTWCYSVLE
jgi:hypothetical protein